MKPVKIFEIKGDDWMRGFARQTSSILGGIFTLANGFDPFRKNGIYQPGMANQALSSVSGGNSNFLTPFSAAGLGYFYAHGAIKLYKVKTTDNTVTDETANITVGTIYGANVWRNKYLYALATEVRKIELGAGTDTSLLTGLTATMGGYNIPHIMATGADLGLNQYITNGNLIAKLILETGTTGNVVNAFSLEAGMVARDLANDGRYLVIISDNNASDATEIKSKCVVTFWDMVKTSADVIWKIDDTKLIGVKIVDGIVYIIGYENIYACTAGSPPVVIYSFTGNATITTRPTNAAAVAQRNGVLYWIGNNNRVYAYGNPLNPSKKIFYNPYFIDTGTEMLAILPTPSKFFVATNTPGIVEAQSGTGVATSSLMITAPITFGQRYQFAYAKIVLRGRLVTGESLRLQGINSEDGNNVVTSDDVRTFTTSPGQSVFLFYRIPAASSVADFEEISAIFIEASKRAIVSFAIFATPLEDQYQNL